jgi:hypothetical protein
MLNDTGRSWADNHVGVTCDGEVSISVRFLQWNKLNQNNAGKNVYTKYSRISSTHKWNIIASVV